MSVHHSHQNFDLPVWLGWLGFFLRLLKPVWEFVYTNVPTVGEVFHELVLVLLFGTASFLLTQGLKYVQSKYFKKNESA